MRATGMRTVYDLCFLGRGTSSSRLRLCSPPPRRTPRWREAREPPSVAPSPAPIRPFVLGLFRETRRRSPPCVCRAPRSSAPPPPSPPRRPSSPPSRFKHAGTRGTDARCAGPRESLGLSSQTAAARLGERSRRTPRIDDPPAPRLPVDRGSCHRRRRILRRRRGAGCPEARGVELLGFSRRVRLERDTTTDGCTPFPRRLLHELFVHVRRR